MNATYFTVTAATLRAVLCFTDANNTPKIAYDKDSLAIPLNDKIKALIGDKDGSQYVQCKFDEDESELLEQLKGIFRNICKTFEYAVDLVS